MGKDPDQIRREIEDTRDRMGDTVDALAYKADVPNRVKDNISDRVDGVKSAIGSTASRLGSAVTGTTGDVREGTKRTVGMIAENPLALLFGGAAVGFLLGSLFASTEIENDRLGELSDSLKEQAKDAGGQVLEHGKAVLRETAQAAQQSAQDHGQQLAGQARDQFEEIKTAASDGYTG